ncbi:hypothetical protein MML48_9g00006477 [Holotrichia oblita]|uniref:Uncharacterized protein n=1 Tax=Holotrichia oblita TaxID=644536 RepID=A0ACB9SIK2_HOLOL|nr:hypothetical protein MML48_9g00006477 [Holotrichia oblita]
MKRAYREDAQNKEVMEKIRWLGHIIRIPEQRIGTENGSVWGRWWSTKAEMVSTSKKRHRELERNSKRSKKMEGNSEENRSQGPLRPLNRSINKIQQVKYGVRCDCLRYKAKSKEIRAMEANGFRVQREQKMQHKKWSFQRWSNCVVCRSSKVPENEALTDSVLGILKELRYENLPKPRQQQKKINVLPGFNESKSGDSSNIENISLHSASEEDKS